MKVRIKELLTAKQKTKKQNTLQVTSMLYQPLMMYQPLIYH